MSMVMDAMASTFPSFPFLPPRTAAFHASAPPRRFTFARASQLKDSSLALQEEPQNSGEQPPLPSSIPPLPAFKSPQARRFYVRGDKWLDILGCSLALPMRLGSGAFVEGYKTTWVPEAEFPSDSFSSVTIAGRKLIETSNLGPRPEQPIEIYDFESCPFCRKVREIVSILDLDALFYPCPRDGPQFRQKSIELGGKRQFPYMVDPNTGVAMYESDDIIKYLVEKYGNGKVPLMLSLGIFTTLTAGLAMVARLTRGSMYTPARSPEKVLELWAYEASPFCKIVREVLVELELPHIYHSTPRGSRKRDELFRRTGHFQVPYLEDPNTGVKMFESAEIIEYLQATYSLPKS